MDGGPLIFKAAAIAFAAVVVAAGISYNGFPGQAARAQTAPTPAPFDRAAAIAKIKGQIKGRENEPADKVFRNIQTPFVRSINAGRLLPVMEIAFSRSLGVDCTHCHTPDRWEADDKPQKQVARDMAAMMARINGELLKGVRNLKSPQPTINCTTCHRGEIKPALNIAPR